jgi:rhodanese-related sulfurtransferase
MKTTSAEEIKARIDAGELLNLLDVREPNEHAEFNIGGILLPLGKIHTLQIEDIEDWREKEVIIYCRSGNRSSQAVLILEQLGFVHVVNLTGGMLDWQMKFA